jgi:tRNA(Ile)-lysidine synthase
MLTRLPYILQRECKIDARNFVLVGVSGGPDSLVLLDILHRLGYLTVCAHLNHGLRPEAATDTLVVQQFANNLGVSFVTEKVDTMAYADEHLVSIEEAARNLRYNFLFTEAARVGAQAVVVGHTADDQVETVLMHLLRGSGLAGLRGMEYRTIPSSWSETIPLVRPLLSFWRADILDYCDEYGLEPVTDASNVDTTFFRNRLRHELIPILEKYNPRFRQGLLRTSQSLAGDYDLMQNLTAEAWESCLIRRGTGYLAFNLPGFQKLPVAIQRHLLRRAIAYHRPGLRDIDFDSIERGLGFLSAPKRNAQLDLIAGLRLLREGDEFWLATWEADLVGLEFPAIRPGEQFTLTISTTLFLNEDWQIQVDDLPDVDMALEQAEENQDPFQAWLDISGMDLPLILRPRQRGDRFQPLGMGGNSMKLSDLMVNLKLPSRARATWPLVCAGENILWVPGFRLSHLARIKPTTLQAIHLHLSRSSSS